MKEITENVCRAIRLVARFTGGSMNADLVLCGPDRAEQRQEIMAALLGHKVPKSKSGITALIDELYRQCWITGDCSNERNKNFGIFARGVMGTPNQADKDMFLDAFGIPKN